MKNILHQTGSPIFIYHGNNPKQAPTFILLEFHKKVWRPKNFFSILVHFIHMKTRSEFNKPHFYK